jgi:hypothetical protein
VAIEKIQEGERVLSTNEETGEVSYQRVSRTFVHRYAGELVTLKAGRESLQVTPNHPVWVEGKGWTPAGELAVGEKVVLARGEKVRLETVETTPVRGPPILVYNLEVENTHTYFVGHEGVWVHNKPPLYHYTDPTGAAHIANTGQITPHPTGMGTRPYQQVWATPTPPNQTTPQLLGGTMGNPYPTHAFQIQNPGPGWSGPHHGPLPSYAHTPPVQVSGGGQLYWDFNPTGDPIIVVPVFQR